MVPIGFHLRNAVTSNYRQLTLPPRPNYPLTVLPWNQLAAAPYAQRLKGGTSRSILLLFFSFHDSWQEILQTHIINIGPEGGWGSGKKQKLNEGFGRVIEGDGDDHLLAVGSGVSCHHSQDEKKDVEAVPALIYRCAQAA